MNNPTLQQHLRLLGYQDGDTVCYRGFHPDKEKQPQGRKAKARVPKVPAELSRWERDGFGVYLVVNPGGDRDTDITQGRAFFYEHDELPKDISRDLWQSLGLPEPTFQVDTGDRSIHSYWVLAEDCSVEEWKALQADLLEFADGDRTLKNPSRVMRLADFKHGETGKPATIISQSGNRYDYATLREIVPVPTPVAPVQSPQGAIQGQATKAINWSSFDRSFSLPYPEAIPLEVCLSTASREALSKGMGEGGRNATGAALARDLIGTAAHLGALGQRYDGDPWALFSEYCDRCSPPLPQGERETIWKSAQRANPGPSLSPEAVGECAKTWLWKHRRSTAAQATTAAQGKALGAAIEPGTKRPKHALQKDQVMAAIGAKLAFNELKNAVELDGERVLDFDDLRLKLADMYHVSVPMGNIKSVVAQVAKNNAYHPVLKYLEKCHASHGHHTDVLEGIAGRYFGTTEPIYETYIKKTLVSAVARIYTPVKKVCKVDTALILQGPQGYGKSTFFRTLAGDDCFDDSMGAGIGDKDERLKLHQFWILEWAELETIFKKKDASATKAFLSCQTDVVRPAYASGNLELNRRSIIVGSTNQDNFLTDSTGNRRFWVVPVKQRIDTAMLKIERDEIWAAAVALYRSGYAWWLTEEEEVVSAEENEQWRAEDPWTPAIRAYLLQYHESEVTTAAILTHALRVEVGQQTKALEMRVGDILRGLGWKRIQRRINGEKKRVWVRGGDTPEPLKNSSSGESADMAVPTAPTSLKSWSSLEPLQDGSSSECPHRPHLEPQKSRNFQEISNGNGNGHHPQPLDISDEQLAQLLGGDNHGN